MFSYIIFCVITSNYIFFYFYLTRQGPNLFYLFCFYVWLTHWTDLHQTNHLLLCSLPANRRAAGLAGNQWAAAVLSTDSEAESAILFVFVSVFTGSEGGNPRWRQRWAEGWVKGELSNHKAGERRGAGRSYFYFDKYYAVFHKPGVTSEKC